MRDVVLYATDTMADWEYAYLTVGLAMADEMAPDRYRLRVASQTGEPVTTMGRLHVVPGSALPDLDPGGIALLVLPGGTTWDTGHEPVLELATALVQAGTPVAAICGGTLGLARAGLLDGRPHTSNAPEFLAASGYGGAHRYVEARVVEDGWVITAPGTMPIDFTAAIFRRLELFPPEMIEAWYGLYTTGERRYFDQLTGGGEQ